MEIESDHPQLAEKAPDSGAGRETFARTYEVRRARGSRSPTLLGLLAWVERSSWNAKEDTERYHREQYPRSRSKIAITTNGTLRSSGSFRRRLAPSNCLSSSATKCGAVLCYVCPITWVLF